MLYYWWKRLERLEKFLTAYRLFHLLTFISYFVLFCQTPIEKLQKHQEALKEEVMTVKAKLRAVLDHTTQLEAMMKALMKHHAISVEEEEEGEHDD